MIKDFSLNDEEEEEEILIKVSFDGSKKEIIPTEIVNEKNTTDSAHI